MANAAGKVIRYDYTLENYPEPPVTKILQVKSAGVFEKELGKVTGVL
ncbi:hypothetical protein [Hydrotalea sp.]|nr:hypothetical protein [Hydrotalea sp.]